VYLNLAAARLPDRRGTGRLQAMDTTPAGPLRIKVNGETKVLADVADCAALVGHLGLTGRRIALERNGEIVPRSQLAGTPLADEDVIEIVVAVGGG